MELHLFSTPGEPFLTNILAAARPILAARRNPLVAYLPAAAVERHFVRETKAAFRSLAEVRAIKVESHSPAYIWGVLDRATLLYIPGGNTYLMAARLRASGLIDELKERLHGGLPLVAFSAGAVLCGSDILTSNDENDCGCANFHGLGLTPFSLNVHFPAEEGPARQERIARLEAYAQAHNRPVLALEDEAHLHITVTGTTVVQGGVWKISRNAHPVQMSPEQEFIGQIE
jgi:peptidase E